MISQVHPLERFLWELTFHRPLDEEDREALLGLPMRMRQLDPGAYLVREGNLPANCSVLIDGFAFRQKTTGDGGRQIMALCIPGDAVDLQNMFMDVADHAVQMLTSGKVADLKREDLQNLASKRPAIGTAIIKATLVEASILREWAGGGMPASGSLTCCANSRSGWKPGACRAEGSSCR